MRLLRNSKVIQFVFDKLRGEDLSKFPVEQVRLRSVWYLVIISTVCTSGYARTVTQNTALVTGCQWYTKCMQ